jgi:CRISPR-associated protein Cmr5
MATTSIQRTQEQERAAKAYTEVSSVKGKLWAKKYKSLVRSAPADIQTNGLGQTVAFWRAKAKDEHKTLYKHVSEWLKPKFGYTGELHQWIIDAGTSSDDYRRATVEAMAYLGWLKRFSEAEIEGEDYG